jgi:hypothetical protein
LQDGLPPDMAVSKRKKGQKPKLAESTVILSPRKIKRAHRSESSSCFAGDWWWLELY